MLRFFQLKQARRVEREALNEEHSRPTFFLFLLRLILSHVGCASCFKFVDCLRSWQKRVGTAKPTARLPTPWHPRWRKGFGFRCAGSVTLPLAHQIRMLVSNFVVQPGWLGRSWSANVSRSRLRSRGLGRVVPWGS